MRNKLLLSLLTLTTGCSGVGRGLIDAGGAAGGAYIGNTLGHGDIGATVAGAAGGALLSEGAQSLVRSGKKKSFEEGYKQGQSDSVKQQYWRLQEAQRTPK